MLSGKSTKVLFNALENYHYEILNISSLSQKYEPDRSLLSLEHWMLMSGTLPAMYSPTLGFGGSRHLISLTSLQWLLQLWVLFKYWCCPRVHLVLLGVVSLSIFFNSHNCCCLIRFPSQTLDRCF